MALEGAAAGRRVRRRARLLGHAARAAGAAARTSSAVVVLLAVVGAANSVEDVAVFTLLQRLVPDDVLTRVLGLVWGLAMGAVALGLDRGAGARRAPWARARPSPSSASILPLLALVTYRRLVEIDRAVAPAAELGLVKGVPMFAPLSIAAKERRRGEPGPRLRRGRRVRSIRAGEVGDRFYIVGERRSRDRRTGRRVTAGHGRLLRRDRVAAGRAAHGDRHGDAPTRVVYALERDDFLAVVTGHSAADAAGREVAEGPDGADLSLEA